METVMGELGGQPWAAQLIANIGEKGGLTRTNKARFFELRFGYALHRAGIVPSYEIPGEGESTLDFGFNFANQMWAVEVMRLEETEAVRRATHYWIDDGIQWVRRLLSTSATDKRGSEEGETLKAVQRICQKCERDGHPHKFPVPAGAFHVILVDFRTFLNGGDRYDRIHVGLGGEYLTNEFHQRFWEGVLISGVFSSRTAVRGAVEARQRLHFIGFVKEEQYEPGAFGSAIQFIANPHLFANAEDVQAAIATWPLKPTTVLNARPQ